MKNVSLLEPLYETIEKFFGMDIQEELEDQPLIKDAESEDDHVVIRSSN